ncbi:hypothetical protein VPH35_113393 [Triticum aestivum]|uniref:DUF3615 domain-containing protein n=1 Tax=Triticum turgidum subsp. durum TaxID=4567 RepID=A0A9R0YYB1_TRITD|nr:CASP-like protein 4A2 [Triticum aestivum]VAI62712.1 unnamed protein product [Triticum turgidum subsp. durum]
MTGLHDAPATREPRRSKRLQRSMPEAATPPPARRTRRTKRPAPPREAEPSVPAARAARSSSPRYSDRELVDVVALPPPPAPRAETPVPPPERGDSPRTAYVLRNHRAPDTGIHKPTPHPWYEKREIKLDQPRLSKKQLKRAELWNAPACARKGLERYNDMNQGDEHELVEAVGVKSFSYCGPCLHANFLARRKVSSSCDDLVPKYFFAELTIDADGLSCVSCFKFDSVDWKNFGGCGVCPATFVHPAGGGYIGARPEYRIQPAPSGLQLSFSF